MKPDGWDAAVKAYAELVKQLNRQVRRTRRVIRTAEFYVKHGKADNGTPRE